MAKEELLTIEGVVDEILPDGRFGVMLDNDFRIITYTAGKMRRYRNRSIVGDRVQVEMTPYDPSKGRIVYREKVGGRQQGRAGGIFAGDAYCGGASDVGEPRRFAAWSALCQHFALLKNLGEVPSGSAPASRSRSKTNS